MARKNTHEGKGKIVGLGLALVAAAAGAFYLYGTKEGKVKRKELKKWVSTLKGEVTERLATMKDVTEDTYYSIVDEVRTKYAGVKNIDPEELSRITDDLKKHWKSVKKQYTKGTRGVK